MNEAHRINSTYGRALIITVERIMRTWPGPEPITVRGIAKQLHRDTHAPLKPLRERVDGVLREMLRAGLVQRVQQTSAHPHRIPFYVYTLTPHDHVRPVEDAAPGNDGQAVQAGGAEVPAGPHGPAGR